MCIYIHSSGLSCQFYGEAKCGIVSSNRIRPLLSDLIDGAVWWWVICVSSHADIHSNWPLISVQNFIKIFLATCATKLGSVYYSVHVLTPFGQGVHLMWIHCIPSPSMTCSSNKGMQLTDKLVYMSVYLYIWSTLMKSVCTMFIPITCAWMCLERSKCAIIIELSILFRGIHSFA